MSVAIIQQRISAGGNFDGTSPPGTPIVDKDIKRFPAAATGGLFDFEITGPHTIMGIELHLGDQTSWTLHKKDSDGEELLIWSGTTEDDFVTLAEDRTLMYEGETLLLRTVGATVALKCRIAVERL